MSKSVFGQALSGLAESIRNYLEIRLSLAKLEVLEKTAKIISLILAAIFLFTLFMLFLLFISMAAATWFGNMMNSEALGYLGVALIYLVFGFIVLSYRRKLFLGAVIKHLSEIFFEDKNPDENEK